jgi:hypothetical protein
VRFGAVVVHAASFRALRIIAMSSSR